MSNLLLVEDDQSFGYILKAYLEMNDFRVHWVKEGKKSMETLQQFPFDLCILDIMLPDIDGFEVAKRIRAKYREMPFIFLTAKALKVDKLMGYKLGCDDYITKPVDEELLLLKIQAILKRLKQGSTPDSKAIYSLGEYTFDFSQQILSGPNFQQQLTNKEAQLLQLLCEHQGQLVRRDRALKLLWGKNDLFNRKTMDVFIFKLRKYLSKDPSVQIRNVHGKGFVLDL